MSHQYLAGDPYEASHYSHAVHRLQVRTMASVDSFHFKRL